MLYTLKLSLQKEVEARSEEDFQKKRDLIVKGLVADDWMVDVENEEEVEDDEPSEDEGDL